MKTTFPFIIFLIFPLFFSNIQAQEKLDSSLLNIDRIYNSSEFRQARSRSIKWIEEGEAYLSIEKSNEIENAYELVRYESRSQKKSIFVPAAELIPKGSNSPINIENFTLSEDETKVLIFTNSSRVWRSNTKGDYWVYDLINKSFKQLGEDFPSSSLMFAKFSTDNEFVAYVHDFNLYKENFTTGEVNQLTNDGNKEIINGTFDWVYEEEFGCRDGFRWSQDGKHIAFWQLDASQIGTFYMINNTDSIYSKMIPVQYPKVGREPSACKIGILPMNSKQVQWIPVPGGEKENYIPAIQWISNNLLLIQQMNRKQNELNIYTWDITSGKLRKIYTETEETWVDLTYPDLTANQWGNNDLVITDKGTAFLRMTENDAWRHVYKIHIKTREKELITRGTYDVASVCGATTKQLFFMASPGNSTQRYLYSVGLDTKEDTTKITPFGFSGVNNYNLSPNGKYAIHTHNSVLSPRTVRLVSLPKHKIIKTLVDNKNFKNKLGKIQLPEVAFFKITTTDGIEIDGRMIKPLHFDPDKKYPLLFHVYGEPWGQVATDSWIGEWNIMLAQQGYIVIDMDNRGTPCLKGSAWRKSIYRKIGVINSRDQAMAAKEVIKWPFVDPERIAVWGWSGGGSMTLNLLFRYPEIYKTGMAVAAVSNQLVYDNIYQERYMGLPQENMEDFVEGSPITYAKNLKGNLLIVHGTADDNVHYQSAELLINELIKQNKQFQIMPYPNRSHGIFEGSNTRRHLYTLLTNYLHIHTPINNKK